MARNLTSAAKQVAGQKAANFIVKYKHALKANGITLVQQPEHREGHVNAFFKGKKKITHLHGDTFKDERCGCSTATVTLHPHPDWKALQLKSSKTLPNVPQALYDLRRAKIFPNEQFISGHMINANFGGDHTDPGNQTVLTTAANGQHDFDEAIKEALIRMGDAIWGMCKTSQAEDADDYLNELYEKWTIKIDVEVGSDTWFDTYNADANLKNDATVQANKYPLNAIATEIVFTAKADGTPTADDIATKLQIHKGKIGPIANAIAEFKGYMNEAARFELRQPAPTGLDRRSAVATTATTRKGEQFDKTAPNTHLPLKPRGKKGKTGGAAAAKPKPVSVKVPCYLTWGTTSTRLAVGAETDIGYDTPGYPWTEATDTALTGDPIFRIDTPNSQRDGSAWVTRGEKVRGRITVAGAELGDNDRLPLESGETIVVYDRDAPDGHYELTFEQV